MSEEEKSKQASGESENNSENSESKKASAAKKEEGTSKQTTAKSSTSQKDSSSKKEEEPPIEDKPFPEFIEQHYQPALKEALTQEGIQDLELEFKKDKFPLADVEECSQVVGKWDGGKRCFNVYFLEDDITGEKAFCYSASDAPPSTIESFMIDERKVNLELLVMYTVQRLNAQKWLSRN